MSPGDEKCGKTLHGSPAPRSLWSTPWLGRPRFSYQRHGGFLAEQVVPGVGQAGEMEEMSWKDQCMR